MELTIQQLADRVGMTPRNIREWQTIGVLPAPERRGRTAYYGVNHVARIERVKSLRADGFPLDIIRQFLDRGEESAADVLALSSAVLDPAGHAGTATVSRAELEARFGAGAEQALVHGGLVDALGDGTVVVKDIATLDYVAGLTELGLPLDAVVDGVTALVQNQGRAIAVFVDMYRDTVWQPFVDAGLPADRFGAIADSSGRMRELIISLGGQTLRRATDAVIGKVAVEQATRLDGRDER